MLPAVSNILGKSGVPLGLSASDAPIPIAKVCSFVLIEQMKRTASD
jgi:hypothetical protein